MDGDRVAGHLRHDRGPARPGPDDPLVATAVHVDNLGHQVVVDERSFLDRTRHGWLPSSSLRCPTDDQFVRGLGLAGPPLLLAPGARRMASTTGLAFTAAERMVDGVHGHAAHARSLAAPAVPAGLAPA